MAAVTLTALIARARQRADQESASAQVYVPDAEVINYINEGAKRLHELLVRAYDEEYAVTESTLTLVAGTSDYDLPSDFFKLIGVDLVLSGRTVSLRRYQTAERAAFKNSTATTAAAPRYKLVGGTLLVPQGKLRLLPTPAAAGSGTLTYVPLLTVTISSLSSVNEFPQSGGGAYTINFPNGWEKYVVACAARDMLMKEESDVRELTARIEKWETELADIAENRDAGQPIQAVDRDTAESDLWWP